MPARKSPRRRPLLELLEPRQLLSTVNVTSFGATPNDGSDDSFAVQRAINSSAPGDTIVFPAGTYNISQELDPLGGKRIFQGQGATLQTNGIQYAFHVHGNDVTIEDFTFNGVGVYLDTPSGAKNANIYIDNNVFNVSGPNANGIEFTTGLQTAAITNNYFTGSVFGVYGYNYNNLVVANNEFVNIVAGMHVDAFGNSGNLLVEQNYLSGVHGMGLEFQGSATNDTFQDNWYENPTLSSTFRVNSSSFAYSLILDKSSNITIQRNVVIAPQRPDGVGARVGFEVGGDNTYVTSNYVNGINQVVADNDGEGSSSVVVAHNQFMNYLEGPGISFPAPNRTFQAFDNGPNTQLTGWDLSRGKPGRNHRLPGTSPSIPIPGSGGTIPVGIPGDGGTDPGDGGTSTPVLAPPDAPSNLVATALSSSRIQLTWQDNSNDELGFKVERSTDQLHWVEIADMALDSTAYLDTNIPAGTTVYYRVFAYNAAGNGDYSNVAQATTQGSDNGDGGGTSPTGGNPTQPPPPTNPFPTKPTGPGTGPIFN